MSNTDAGYTPSNGPEPAPPGEGAQRAPFPLARLFLSILFGFLAFFAFHAAIFAAVIYWVLVAINREPHPQFRQVLGVLVQYVAQTLGYVAWLHDNQPFPFGPLPKGDVV
jgi:uncharacterized protein DUF4389